jgi:transcription antitermination factor NusG
MALRWFAVRVTPAAATLDPDPEERGLAERQINDLGIETYCPFVDERVGRGKRTVPLFHGYIFARFNRDSPEWAPMKRLPGVASIVSLDRRLPTPIRPGAVEAIQAAADQRVIWLDPRSFLHSAGVPLRVLEGPFLDETGACIWSEPDRVALMLTIFGRPTPVILPAAHVARA